MNNEKINIIICWFGEFPNYYKLWEETVKYNPSITWTIVGPNKPPGFNNSPANLNYLRCDKADFQKRSLKAGIPIKDFKPYKLCDLRPAYGRIFEDILNGYDFWGFGDIDVLYGDVRSVVDGKLKGFDAIGTGSPYRVSGPLALFRNINRLNDMYLQIKLEKFQSPNNLALDEKKWSRLLMESSNIKCEFSEKQAGWAAANLRWEDGKFFHGNKCLHKAICHFGGGPSNGARDRFFNNFSLKKLPIKSIVVYKQDEEFVFDIKYKSK